MTEGVTDLMYIASGTKDAQLDISPAKPLNGQKIMDPVLQGRHVLQLDHRRHRNVRP